MEIQNEDGSTTLLQTGLKSEFGRGLGLDPEDRTVSRRHVSFQLRRDRKSRVHFEVTGKNPIWVQKREGDEIRVFRSSEDGEMEAGDKFCVSSMKPRWFTLKRVETEGENGSETEGDPGIENELAESLQNSHSWKDVEGFDIGSVDVSDIDPVKDFGFLVIGHEFDQYSKRIGQPKSWDWFLVEPKKDSEDDESVEKKGKKRARRKGKKGEINDDDEWTGESEEDKELIAKTRKVQKPKYSTRSKDSRKPVQKKTSSPREDEEEEEDDEDEDEEDETLGGFIVTDDDAEQEEIEDEEEEDFDDEDEDE